MKLSIRSKLILAISALMVVLFSITANLFISEKKSEIAQDIYVNALAFSRLTSATVGYDYDLYLAQGSFAYFNREIQNVFKENADVSVLKVASYSGEVLYDSEKDTERKYEGEARKIDDKNLLNQLHSKNISLKTSEGKIYFIKLDENGAIKYVNFEEKAVESLPDGSLIQYIVAPSNQKYSVIYELNYHNLVARVDRMTMRIIYLAIFAVMLGMILSYVMSTKITKPVHQLAKGVEEIAKGNFKTQVAVTSNDEIGFLTEAFNKMAQDLEKSIEAKIYQERVTSQLKVAAQIQDQLVPDEDEIPKMAGVEISADLVPAEEVGGDIYDFLKLDENRLLMYLGDVTGHGIPAGIISSISNALFYGYSTLGDLKKILLEVNRVLKVKTLPTMFMTLCLMQWDALAKKFSYASAGHEQILHYSASAKKAEYKLAGGIALGMLSDISKHINVVDIDFQVGDYLVIYSDGIPECWRNEKELYGPDRLKAAIEKFSSLGSAEAVKKAILADVKEFAAGYKQMDDITIMVVKRV